MIDESLRRRFLDADVDLRLAELWAMLWHDAPNPLTPALEDEVSASVLAQVVRHAYAQG